MRRFFLSLLFFCAGAALHAAAPPATVPSETSKIEALLTTIGAQTTIKFIRNGRDYDSATAVKFLREKWERQRATVGTAREFINQVARQSSTTGTPYRIRMPDGREVECAVFLTSRLTELESK